MKHENVRVSRYSDSGYAGDREDEKYTTEYCTFVGESCHLEDKKQDVSCSSAEAEYKAINYTV